MDKEKEKANLEIFIWYSFFVSHTLLKKCGTHEKHSMIMSYTHKGRFRMNDNTGNWIQKKTVK